MQLHVEVEVQHRHCRVKILLWILISWRNRFKPGELSASHFTTGCSWLPTISCNFQTPSCTSSLAVVFSNKNQSSTRSHPFCMSACRCTVASYENHSLYGNAVVYCYLYCIIMWPLYRGQPNNFSGYFIQVHLVTYFPWLLCWCCLASNSACGMSVSTCVYACTSASVHLPVLAH